MAVKKFSISEQVWAKAMKLARRSSKRRQRHRHALCAEEQSVRAKENWNKIPDASLSGPIHHVWAKEKFQKPWCDEYEAFEPALRIASRLLTADHALHFWHAVFFSPRIPRGDIQPHPRILAHYPGLSVHKIDAPKCLTPDQRSDTLVKLELLSKHIRYELRPSTTSLFDAQTDLGPGGIFTILGENTFRHVLREHRSASPQKYQTYFLLAALLCHELAHAAQMLFAHYWPKTPRQSNYDLALEPFFADQPINELGYAWEAVALGGLAFRDCTHVGQAARDVCHWVGPNARSAVHRGLWDVDEAARARALDGADNAGRGNLLTRIPLRWCYRFSTPRFWDETVPARGAAAFALPTNAVGTINVRQGICQSVKEGYNDKYVAIGYGDVCRRATKLRFHYTRADIAALLGVDCPKPDI